MIPFKITNSYRAYLALTLQKMKWSGKAEGVLKTVVNTNTGM